MASVRWAAAHPGRILRHRGWFLQRLKLDRLLPPVEGVGGRLDHVAPQFLDRLGRALDDPTFVAVADAAHMRDEDVVLGFMWGEDVRAYPWWILDDHHSLNDVVGGRPMAIVFCEQCGTGVAFDPVVNGRRLMFDHGPHYNGTNTLIDRETRTVWAPYLARAIQGKLVGTRVEILPLQHMTWGAWRKLHPETKVVAPEFGSRNGHGSDHTIGLGRISPSFRKSLVRWDDRLPFGTLVMGAVTERAQRAYPLEALKVADGVVNDVLGDEPIVVFAFQGEGSYGALAFSRRLDGRVLSFRAGEEGPCDEATGSRWSYEGLAASGSMAGRQLAFVESHVSEWYVWPAHFPRIEIWEPMDRPSGSRAG